MSPTQIPQSFTCLGRTFSPEEIALIQEVVETCSGLSQTELARTLADLLGWNRPSGGPKNWECRDLLLRLEGCGLVKLPEVRLTRPMGSRVRVPVTERGDARSPLEGTLRDVAPVLLDRVTTEDQRLLFRELVGRHHYLGFKVPFGAYLRYLIRVERPEPQVVGCVQFSSPAWSMGPRDAWIGWDAGTRKRNLQRIVNNTRFLILPWVRVRYLASSVLAQVARRLPKDWEATFGIRPVLAESLVDPARFEGTCYLAANWVHVGTTTGRGRMDRTHNAPIEPKEVFLLPLHRGFRRELLSDAPPPVRQPVREP
ncbi:MAG: DUF4338 domain-containing protein [Deltaproteobacteria bacterium]|nr:DUF4338 domain-containing protein [Deltaproteobacteria bacterium]